MPADELCNAAPGMCRYFFNFDNGNNLPFLKRFRTVPPPTISFQAYGRYFLIASNTIFDVSLAGATASFITGPG